MTEEQIIPHPYTYRPARAIKECGKIRWFDILTGEELPPYFGYGSEAQEKVDAWYKEKKMSANEKIKLSNESYFDYCNRTEQMAVAWGSNVWDYLVPQLNNWIDTAHLHEGNSSYYREKLIEIGKMLGEEVYICDDGTKSQDVLIEKIKEVLEKVIYQNKEVKEKRIPALHKKGTILRTVSSDPFRIKYIMRVNDDSENGFTDYDITHYDLEVLILDPSAEFVQTDKGNFLDYTKEAMEIS